MKELAKHLENIRQELIEEHENGNLWEYFEDALDVEYTIDRWRCYLGVKIWLTLGGPNIFLDTRNSCLKGAWGTDRDELHVPESVCDSVDAMFAELYEC